jgi:hypothetical protein
VGPALRSAHLEFSRSTNSPCHSDMDIRAGYALFHTFQQDRFTFGYSGIFNDEHTAHLIELSDALVSCGVSAKGSRGRLSFLMVEAYQNIIRHRVPLIPEIAVAEGRSLFLFRSTGEGHNLVAINPVQRSSLDDLQAKLDRVNGMDKAELKDLFRLQLQAAPNGQRGAGLGFIEMARRSENDLGYVVRGMGPETALFAFGARLGSEMDYRQVIGDAAVLHGYVAMNDLLLFHVGERQRRVQEVLEMILATDVIADTSAAERCLQLFCDAGTSLDYRDGLARGVTVLAREGAGYSLVMGRVMANEAAETFLKEWPLAQGSATTQHDLFTSKLGSQATAYALDEGSLVVVRMTC